MCRPRPCGGFGAVRAAAGGRGARPCAARPTWLPGAPVPLWFPRLPACGVGAAGSRWKVAHPDTAAVWRVGRSVMSCTVKSAVAGRRPRAVLATAAAAVALLAGTAPATASTTGTAVGGDVGSGIVAAPVPPCRGGQLAAGGAERLGADAVRITVVNESGAPCVLRGYPTVALAGQGSPANARSLTVVHQGPARPVVLPAGGAAVSRVSFAPVLGEADGYCASGAEPFAAPSMVVGVAGVRLQIAPDDGGNFAVCGTVVRATSFRPAS
ncbi:DUF4232 domain-containing protein [Streptomyces sp. NPDC058874]|uniref:DUF4232 domain-containing protein n=2 Tax=unclassified Streptomyces TaxID=2593676 RepID=UPI0036C264F8